MATIRRARGFLRRAGYLFFLFAVAFLFLEITQRLGFFRPSFDHLGLGIVLDQKILFRIKPASRPDINLQGYRGENFHTEKSNRGRILFLGDSFVFGSNVSTENTLPSVLERRLGPSYEVFNLGVLGYGPDQSLIQFLEEGLEYEPDIVILALFPANDFADLSKNKLFELDASGSLKARKPNLLDEWLPPLRTSYLLRYWRMRYEFRGQNSGSVATQVREEDRKGLLFKELFRELLYDSNDFDLFLNPASELSNSKIKLMRAILRRFKESADARLSRFFVVVIPSREEVLGGPALPPLNETAEELCEEMEIPVVALYPFLVKQKTEGRVLFDASGHFSVEGYEAAAGIIAEAVTASVR